MVGLGALGALLVGAVAASPEDLRLDWSAPPECPDREAVLAHIDNALHDGATRPVAAKGVVEATLVEDGPGYSLNLVVQLEAFTARRTIQATDCSLLARAGGLVVAVALDPQTDEAELAETMELEAAAVSGEPNVEETLLPPPPPAANAPRDFAPSEPVDVEPAEPDPPSQRRRGAVIDAAVRFAGGVGGGILPGFEGGVSLGLAATGRFWRVEAVGGRWASPNATYDDDPDVGASFRLWSGGPRVCGVPTFGRLEIPLCGGAEFGQIHARAFGAPANREARSLYIAGVVAPGVIWLPRPFIGLFAGVDLHITGIRPAFTGDGRPILHRTSEVAAHVLAGVELRVGTRTARER